jgi:phytol kinase
LQTSALWYEFTPSLWLHIGIIVVWLTLVLAIAEALNRFVGVSAEIVRKVVHIGSGNIILLAWWLQIPAWIGILASILASGATLLSYYVPVLNSINEIGRKSFGTFFYALSIGILIAWFWPLQQPQYAALGVLVMTWGDGFAAIIGQQFGKHTYSVGGIQKSWEGSLTMMGISFGVAGLILLATIGNDWQTWVIAATVAIAATGLETFSKLGIDNLTVPLGSSALSFFLVQQLL